MTDFAGKTVLMMAGGTGGHVIPGLSIAKALIERGARVEWLGSEQGIENRLVPEAGIKLHRLTISGVRGKGRLSLLKAPFMLLSTVSQALKVFVQVRPDLVIGMGGFAAAPGGLAAKLKGVPLIVHEQNAVAGSTNKLLACFAKRIFVAFPTAFGNKYADKTQCIGNPVRDEIHAVKALDAAKLAEQDRLKLLVVGGSLGALALNQTLPQALALMDKDLRPALVHQCGDKHLEVTQQAYSESGFDLAGGDKHAIEIKPFIASMAEAYQACDLVICRSGALTVSEVAAAKRAAIFVPYPYAIDDHQNKNADYLVAAQAAQKIEQADLTPQCLAEQLTQLTQQKNLLVSMASQAETMANTQTNQIFINYCAEVLGV